MSTSKILSYKPGEVIQLPEDTMTPYIVDAGCVASFILTPQGARVIDTLFPPNTGYIPMTPQNMEGYTPNSEESAYKFYMSLAHTQVRLDTPLRMQINAAVTYSGYFFALLSKMDAWKGVLFFILEFGEQRADGTIQMKLLQSTIGEVVRYTRESVSNAVSTLKKKGLVTTHKEGAQPVILLKHPERARALIYAELERVA